MPKILPKTLPKVLKTWPKMQPIRAAQFRRIRPRKTGPPGIDLTFLRFVLQITAAAARRYDKMNYMGARVL